MVDDKLLRLLNMMRDPAFQDKCITCAFLYKLPPHVDLRNFRYTGFTHEILAELKRRFRIRASHVQMDGSVFINDKWLPIVIFGDVELNYVLTLTF